MIYLYILLFFFAYLVLRNELIYSERLKFIDYFLSR